MQLSSRPLLTPLDRTCGCATLPNRRHLGGIQGCNVNTLDKVGIWEEKMARDIKAALAVLKDLRCLSRAQQALVR